MECAPNFIFCQKTKFFFFTMSEAETEKKSTSNGTEDTVHHFGNISLGGSTTEVCDFWKRKKIVFFFSVVLSNQYVFF